MILSLRTPYFKVNPSLLKALHAPKLSLAEIQTDQVPFSLSLYFILIVVWPSLCHLSAETLCEEFALIIQVLSKEKQWSWRKIKVSKLATSLLMFHLTQRCMGSDRSNSLAGRLEALEKCDVAIHEACEVSGLQVWVTQTSYFSSLSFGMQILTPGAMNCTQVRWLSKGKTLQRLVVLLQGNPCCLCFPFPDLSIFNGLL